MEGEILGGRYEVVRELGRGGMGAVYEARHTGTGRRVAVKVITADIIKAPGLIARFEVEARAAGGIDSQHVAQVLDSGTDEKHGAPYIVMEYLSGEDLHQVLYRIGPLPPMLAMRIVAQACLGLEKAHRSKIVHRDVKPANIYLNERDGDEIVVKLLDFGVAKIKAEEGENIGLVLTRTGSLLGSPLYMSPEQARGDKALDQRSDIWSLGIVMYEALYGRTPYHAIEALGSLIIAICSEPPALLHTVAPWVPQEVSAIVHKAIALRAEDRFQTAQEMYKAIKALLPGGAHVIDKSMFVSLTAEDRAHRPAPMSPMASSNPDGSTSQPGLQSPAGRASNPTLAASNPGEMRGSLPSYDPSAQHSAGPPERARTTAGVTSDPHAHTNTPATRSKLPLVIGAVAVVAVAAIVALRASGSSAPSVAPVAPATQAMTAPPQPVPATATAPVVAATPSVTSVTPADTTSAAPAASDTAKVRIAGPMPTASGHLQGKLPVPPGGKATSGPDTTSNVGGRIIRTDLP